MNFLSAINEHETTKIINGSPLHPKRIGLAGHVIVVLSDNTCARLTA
jgi:hypothetical protein